MAVQTVTPADGGQLITRAAAANVGVPHYTVKRNWRRDLSDEIRREGHDYFSPLPEEDDAEAHAFPTAAATELNLIHLVRRPNGEAAIVVGTKTTLYRFNIDLDGYTVDDPDYCPGYWAVKVRWQIIGSGFSANGRRWEWADIDGTTVFSNGIDLPVAYRSEWDAVVPLYELREQGVVCVGTISALAGVLLLADITELTTSQMDTVLDVVKSGTVTIRQDGFRTGVGTAATTLGVTTVTASPAAFYSGDVGRMLIWSDGTKERIATYVSDTQVTVTSGHVVSAATSFRITDQVEDPQWDALALFASGAFFESWMLGQKIAFPDGSVRKIIEVINSTLAKTDTDYPVAAQEGSLDNPLAYAGKEALVAAGIGTLNEIQYRTMWSELNQPTRFAALTPAVATVGSKLLVVSRTAKSLTVFNSVAVIGAGTLGGALTDVRLEAIGPGVARMDLLAQTGGTTSIIQSAAVGSIVGKDDLQDDGSGILKMAPLGGRIIVYKDTNIFIGTYTGIPANPFQFEQVEVAHGRSLFYRNTLISINDTNHIYAGRDRFYQFNLTSRQPQFLTNADLVSNLFYDFARLADTERIYAADNHLTQEAWIVCPANTANPVIAYDYLYSSIATLDFYPSAAATVKEAVFPLVRETGDWFLLGTTQGVLLHYGFVTEPLAAWAVASPQAWQDGKRIYYRRQDRPYSAVKEDYTSVLSGGRLHFVNTFGENHLSNYVLGLSSLPQSSGPTEPIYSVSIYTSRNQLEEEALVGTAVIQNAEEHGLVPVHAIAHHFRDEITVEGQGNPIRINSRTFNYEAMQTSSYHRK